MTVLTTVLKSLFVATHVFVAVVHPPTWFTDAWGSNISWLRVDETPSVVFVGDIQLGRDVERKIQTYGEMYPYERIKSQLQNATYVVGNFEGAIPVKHIPTPDYTMSFSVDPARLAALHDAGVTHLSVANNHSHDKGEAGYRNTVEELAAARLTPLMMPEATDSVVSRITLGGHTLSLIAFDTVDTHLKLPLLQAVIEQEASTTDQQIVIVHWGNEYQDTHNAFQAELGHWLIDQGVDLVIGHHPHVVQDVETYQGKLIVYSLGNFIFDQYFSPAVETGLMVKLTYDSTYHVQLIPVTSADRAASPRRMSESERNDFFAALWRHSNVVPDSFAESVSGVLDSLAISP